MFSFIALLYFKTETFFVYYYTPSQRSIFFYIVFKLFLWSEPCHKRFNVQWSLFKLCKRQIKQTWLGGAHTLVDNGVLTCHFGDVRVRRNTKITGTLRNRTTHEKPTYTKHKLKYYILAKYRNTFKYSVLQDYGWTEKSQFVELK